MPKALLHCFSGTGNSLLAAETLSAELAKQGYETSLRQVEGGFCTNGEDVDLHIFFFPIYATALPHIMARYILHMPAGHGAKAAVFSTNGHVSTRFRDGYQGWALHQARLLLKLRRYDVFYSDTLDLPHNVTVLLPPVQGKNVHVMLDTAAAVLRDAARKIAAGERHHRTIFFLNFLWSVPFGLLFSLFGRRALGKLFAADHRCSSCGLCAKQCPVGNIMMKGGRVCFGWHCEGCLRCINLCPRQSIQMPVARIAAMAFAMLWNPLLAFGVYKAGFLNGPLGSFGGGLVEFLISVAVMIIVFIILDSLLFLLGYIPGVKRLASWGHTRLFGRYDGGKFKA